MSGVTSLRPTGRASWVVFSLMFLTAASVTASLLAPAPPPHAVVTNRVVVGDVTADAKVYASNGWVAPGGSFPLIVFYKTDAVGATGLQVTVELNPAAVFVTSTPAPASGSGTAANPLVYDIGTVAASTKGKIVIEARAKSLTEDPEVYWKDLNSLVTVSATGATTGSARTLGPKVTTLHSARYGERPFPVIMVQYQDIKRCDGVGDPYAECSGNHTSEKLDEVVNSRTTGKSIWQLYTNLSLGQISALGGIGPAPGLTTVPFTPGYGHQFAGPGEGNPVLTGGTCNGTTLGAVESSAGTAAYPNRIENGWYVLPGTQGYYGSDQAGHGLVGALAGAPVLVDGACGPPGKIAYDAASLADPDLDYNDFDTDRDGVVDFFNLVYAGDGGNGTTTPTGINNVWPHKSDLRSQYPAADGQSGYVSKDQLRNLYDQPMYFTTADKNEMTTAVTQWPVYVRVGIYNVNPESAFEAASVIAHEYGHSFGLPDFYSTGSRSTYGSWELMASDHFQYMTAFPRQKLGWIVPREMGSGALTVREAKYDTGEIHWVRPDGTPYVLTGTGIHNADVWRLSLPGQVSVDAPSPPYIWYSGAGNNFTCPPANDSHNLDFLLMDLSSFPAAGAITLKFKSRYDIEWDYDYAFVMVGEETAPGTVTWTTVPSKNGTTISNTFNPNEGLAVGADCLASYDNGITGVSGDPNTPDNPNRAASQGCGLGAPCEGYLDPQWIDDEFDLTAFAGKAVILRFSYVTDTSYARAGWWIDDIEIKADNTVVYASNFDTDMESTRIFPRNWSRVNTNADDDPRHAYFLEVRDRIDNDFDSKSNSDRGPPTWGGGVTLSYSDENHGYGNVGVADPPAQTIVDAVPDPGNSTPVLDDAAFNLSRPIYDGCTHVDNYLDPNGPGGNWKLPANLRFAVNGLTGLSGDGSIPGSPATATLSIEVNPDCDIVIGPPTLALGADYGNPDKDGGYSLEWDRPDGAIGPDTIQEATILETLLTDGAEGGLGKWVTSTTGAGAFAWEASATKAHTGANSFWGRTAAGATNVATMLTTKDAIAIPATGDVLLSYWDLYVNEGDDAVILEVSTDDGASWNVLSQQARSARADAGAQAVATEPMAEHQVDLAAYRGQSIKLRFRMQAGPEDRATSTPFGWYVDDILLQRTNFVDLETTTGTSASVSGRASGNYYYRVRTAYGTPQAPLLSRWSDVITATVALNQAPLAVAGDDFSVNEGASAMLNAVGSSDPDGGTLSYSWQQTAGPTVMLSGADTASATFTAPNVASDTALTFTLTVTDEDAATATDSITVTVVNVNVPPVANAGADFAVDEGATAMLSGAGSSDADGDTLTYAWTQTAGPSVTLSGADTATASFTAPDVAAETPLTFSLEVRDPAGDAGTDTVVVTVRPAAVPPPEPPAPIGDNSAGALSPLVLLSLLLPMGLRRRRRH
jgi:M6 family metalloprotease-like protein